LMERVIADAGSDPSLWLDTFLTKAREDVA
jgi:hypothetical protein